MKRYRKNKSKKIIYWKFVFLWCFIVVLLGYAAGKRALMITGIIGVGSFVLAVAVQMFFHRYEKNKYLNSTLYDIDHMTGENFESYLYWYFKASGYRVSTTPKSSDYGADLLLNKNGITTVVQAKRYKDKVGVGAVQQVVGAIRYYHADKAMVVTNSYFTSNARVLAEANDVELWDRTILKNKKRL